MLNSARAHCRNGGTVEQERHFAKERAGFGDAQQNRLGAVVAAGAQFAVQHDLKKLDRLTFGYQYLASFKLDDLAGLETTQMALGQIGKQRNISQRLQSGLVHDYTVLRY